MSYQITVEPATEPITTAEARSQLRNEGESFDDTYIDTLIVSARRVCEKLTNRVFITQTWRQNEDLWSNPINLMVNPVISVSSLKYIDDNNTQQTITEDVSNYQVDLLSDTAAIYEGTTNGYPTLGTLINPIEIISVCGFGDASDVPDDIKHAIKIMVAYFYENREMINVPISSIATQIPIPTAVYSLLTPYRVNVLG